MPRTQEVDTFVAELGHPLEEAINAVRDIVLGVDSRIVETIKWKGPTFVFEGNIASIEPRSKKHVSVLFHQGAEAAREASSVRGRRRNRSLPAVR